MAVSVQFEIGHTAKLRAKKTPEGFTHDWDLYIRGGNKADISIYVEKVVFNLHESFQRPKRVIKEPPYVIHESGYASFVLAVDIHFRNRDEPKRVQYTYDLDLKNHGPPYHRSEEKRFLFENPSEEFRQKLLKGGGVPVVPAGLTGSRSGNPIILPSSFGDPNIVPPTKHKTNSNSGESSIKKQKSRVDDSKINTFANLFGTPDPNLRTSSSKSVTDAVKNTSATNSSSKMYSPNSTAAPSIPSGSSSSKEKSSKESKDRQSSSGSAEKSKDKSERKEKHKSSSSSSPNKDGRSEGKKSSSSNSAVDGNKSEKRNEDKPKKDKNRDKERDRSTSAATGANISGSSTKASSSNKMANSSAIGATGATTAVPASNMIAQRTPTHAHALSTNVGPNRVEEKLANTQTSKAEKETKEKHSSSSSSGKKSKKEKKDKDKDKERDKDKEKEKDKEKREDKQRNSGGGNEFKSKEERSHSSASQSNVSNSPSGHSTPNSLSAGQVKPSVLNVNNSGSSKKIEKETKIDNAKTKSTDKTLERTGNATANVTQPTSNADKKSNVAGISTANNNSSSSSIPATVSASSAKSHKHKKKDKNKDRDKERSNNDKEKEKSKEKHKDKNDEKKEIEKAADVIVPKSQNSAGELKKSANINVPATNVFSHPQTAGTASMQPSNQTESSHNNNNNSEANASTKKSQNKEKKSKDSKSNKDAKRRSETAIGGGELKSKVSKTSTPLSTAGSNIELSDADSRQSAHESVKAAAAAAAAATATTLLTAQAAELHSDSSYSSFPDVSIKQTKDKSATPTHSSPDKALKTTTSKSKENKQRDKEKNTNKNAEKSAGKVEKDDKKRKRNTAAANINSTFVEPPVKQVKKEQNKSTVGRDTTKSPLPRTNSGNLSNVLTKNTKTQNETNVTDVVDNATNFLTPQASSVSPNVNTTAVAGATTLATGTGPAANATNYTNANNNFGSQRNNATSQPASPALTNETIWPNLSELQELHHKIMTLQDNDELQQIVEMIAASGCYEITQRTFDFDLCKLDRSTVERLQEFFATSVS